MKNLSELRGQYSVSNFRKNIMLNKAERFRVLKLYRICCNIGLLPFEVDLTSWELKKTSKIKRFICFISFSSFFLHGLYKIGSLAHSYFLNPNVQPHQLVLHALVAMVCALAIFWYNKVYITDTALYAKCFNITLRGNVGGKRLDCGQLKSVLK